MLPEPLHPVLVHFPIALTTLLLPVAVYGLIASHRQGKRRAWVPTMALASLALAAALIAQQAGDREEHRVERWVGKVAMEHHEEQAERFVWLLLPYSPAPSSASPRTGPAESVERSPSAPWLPQSPFWSSSEHLEVISSTSTAPPQPMAAIPAANCHENR